MKLWRLGRPSATTTATGTASSAAAATNASEGNKNSSSNNSSIALECVYTYNPFNGASVTTIDITTTPNSGNNSDPSSVSLSTSEYRIALGCETGEISIYTFTITTTTTPITLPTDNNTSNTATTTAATSSSITYNIQLLCNLPECYTHGASVTKIRWATGPESIGRTLASCSEDHTVRVYKLGE